MPRIKITNPRNVIEAPIKKNYFKIRATSGPKGDKGDTGATGPQGPQGPQGNAATIYVGSTTTLPVGQDATVENVGSQYAAVLNFGIPQGPQGPQGAKGDKGDKGDKGEQGNTGNTGPAGQNATVYIGTTTTGAPGSQASVYNSGTENNAVLNFTIPQGAKGDTGATGATGPQGPAGQDGKDFAPSVVDSLPAVGEESKLYLTPKAHTTQTATGNPITATITDGAGQIEDFQLDGDTYQQSYSGKNLFNIGNYSSAVLRGGGSAVSVAKENATTLKLTNLISQGSNFCGIPIPNSDVLLGKSVTISGTVELGTGVGDARVAVYAGSSTSVGTSVASANISASGSFTLAANIPASYPSGADRIHYVIYASGNSSPTVGSTVLYSELQLEVGTATDYEPYVGGIASPNPDYPQPIQTVTGEQTVSKVGKNLFNKNSYSSLDAYINSSNTLTYGNGALSIYIECEPNVTYTVSKTSSGTNPRFCVYTTEDTPAVGVTAIATVGTKAGTDTNTSYTITTGADAKYLCVFCKVSSTSLTEAEIVATVQIEKSSSATTYAPYSKTDYPISLGSIELCKLGTYQDYIYKSGDKWYVHKETDKFVFTAETTSADGRSKNGSIGFVINAPNNPLPNKHIPLVGACSHFSIEERTTTWTGIGRTGMNSVGALWFQTGDSERPDSRTITQFFNWLASSGVIYNYALATPTDIEIADATLISQLNAIASASLENGTNTITNTATGSNLAGDMEVDYFGYDPTNRYDKWLWLDINNAYEKLGS